jgi:flagellar hook-basal body complex protein FliE
MDGLSFREGNQFIKSGTTTSDVRRVKLENDQSLSTGESSASFADVLKTSIDKVNEIQKEADVQAQKLATGQTTNLPEVMVAMEKADISLKLMVQVRNKIIDAYQEIMRMQV